MLLLHHIKSPSGLLQVDDRPDLVISWPKEQVETLEPEFLRCKLHSIYS
jgi:hypothetical protein